MCLTNFPGICTHLCIPTRLCHVFSLKIKSPITSGFFLNILYVIKKIFDTCTGFFFFFPQIPQICTLSLNLDQKTVLTSQKRICFAIQKRYHPEQNCSGSPLSLLLPFTKDYLHSTYFFTPLFWFVSPVEVADAVVGYCPIRWLIALIFAGSSLL